MNNAVYNRQRRVVYTARKTCSYILDEERPKLGPHGTFGVYWMHKYLFLSATTLDGYRSSMGIVAVIVNIRIVLRCSNAGGIAVHVCAVLYLFRCHYETTAAMIAMLRNWIYVMKKRKEARRSANINKANTFGLYVILSSQSSRQSGIVSARQERIRWVGKEEPVY